MNVFILDACALIAYFAGETGSENIKAIFKEAIDSKNTKVFINKINLLEVYYDVIRNYDEQEAERMLETVREMPVEIIELFGNFSFRTTLIEKYEKTAIRWFR